MKPTLEVGGWQNVSECAVVRPSAMAHGVGIDALALGRQFLTLVVVRGKLILEISFLPYI